MPVISQEQIEDYIGEKVGTSDWIEISQDRINQFADVTEDNQFIHVDPEAAKATPFGTTIAHGFLTLSMLSKMAAGCVLVLDGIKMGVNYGFEKVRFSNPVKVNKRIRGHFSLMSATQKVPGQWTFKYAVKVEIEDEAKPALVAEWVTMQIV